MPQQSEGATRRRRPVKLRTMKQLLGQAVVVAQLLIVNARIVVTIAAAAVNAVAVSSKVSCLRVVGGSLGQACSNSICEYRSI